MELHDRLIADLMDALDAIQREAQKPNREGSLAYIDGLAGQAAKNCNIFRERNKDGYLVVKGAR